MKRNASVILACAIALALPGCAYETNEPDPKPSTTSPTKTVEEETASILELLRGKEPEIPYGIRASTPMPTTGKCAYVAAIESKTDIQYTVPVKMFAGIGQQGAMIHVEKGILVSWPHDVYLKLKAATPEARDTSASIFQITQRSFESLVSRDNGLQSVVSQLGIEMLAPYYVTTYECLSPSRK